MSARGPVGVVVALAGFLGAVEAGPRCFGSDDAARLRTWLDSDGIEVVWRIGEFDASMGEFALAPTRAVELPKHFPQDPVYIVGRSTPADWPFIQPSTRDEFWSERAEVPFHVVFALPELRLGRYVLVFALTDAHVTARSTMAVAVNGTAVCAREMPLGRDRAFFGETQGFLGAIAIPLPRERLRVGENRLTLTLRGGHWISYDALALIRVNPVAVAAPPAVAVPDSWRGVRREAVSGDDGFVVPSSGGFRALLRPKSVARIEEPWLSAGCDVGLDLLLRRGRLTLEDALPAGARSPVWALRLTVEAEDVSVERLDTWLGRAVSGGERRATLRGAAGSWIGVAIADRKNAVNLTLRYEDRDVLRAAIVHPATPAGTLTWTAGPAGADVAVANGRWRLAKQAESRPAAMVARPSAADAAAVPAGITFDEDTGAVTISDGVLEVLVETRSGLNPRRFRNVRTGAVYADADYVYGSGDERPRVTAAPEIRAGDDGGEEAVFVGRLGDLEITQRFRVGKALPGIVEQVSVRNASDRALDTHAFAAGFAKRAFDGKLDDHSLGDGRFVAVPYRRDEGSGAFNEWTLEDLVWRSGSYGLGTRGSRTEVPAHASEGWAWTQPGADTLLLIKYNPDALEWSLLEPIHRGDAVVVRFGGAGLGKQGDPEFAAELAPGASFTFGETHYIAVDGTWKDAFAAFRAFMDARGHHFPPDYNPPVHWNELYDNPLWWGPDTPERRAEHYRLADMEAEAAKAHELGCEALYLDPGWDTSFASTIWAADRLGPAAEFVRLMKDRYQLDVAIHSPLAGWSDINAYPAAARRRDATGKVEDKLCSANAAYLDEKARRLIALCEDGVRFIMFDGTRFTGPCYDTDHGHSIPLTRHEHVMAYLDLTQRVKRRCPDVLIELHDPIVAGVAARYTPTYFLHALPDSFDELWGFEYMWHPMEDLYGARAMSLYYINLAYNIPIYLHIDLRDDNANALEFWWYASTCRHLGVGGRHKDDRVWAAQKEAMRTYLRLKRFFVRGAFFGLDETIHAHTLAAERKTVLNVFNLSDVEQDREIRFRWADVGLEAVPAGAISVRGARAHVDGDEVTLWANVPARGHRLVEIESDR
jgi:hypothetical protein